MVELYTSSNQAGDGSWLTISEMSDSFQLSLRTLRFYEQIGLIAPERIGTLRRYGPKDRLRVQLILAGKRLGFSLSEVSALIGAQGGACEVASLELSLSQVNNQLAALQKRREDIGEALTELQRALDRLDDLPK